MLIRGDSFITASCIKINTLIVLFLAVRAYFRQQAQVVLMHRTIPPSTIQKALALVFVTTTWVLLGVFLISLFDELPFRRDRKSTRLNSSHVAISYAVFCLKKQ